MKFALAILMALTCSAQAQVPSPAPKVGTRVVWTHEGKNTNGGNRVPDGFFLYYAQAGVDMGKIDISNAQELLVGGEYKLGLWDFPAIWGKENCFTMTAYYLYNEGKSKLESIKTPQVCAIISGVPRDPKDLRITE